MSLSTLPLSYCTNVHPAQRLDDVLRGLTEFTAPTRRNVGRPIAAGLWLQRSIIDELVAPDGRLQPGVRRLRDAVHELDLTCYTLNTFPYGNFHSERVKDQVYIPNWSAPERQDYTLACAIVLAEMLPEGCDGSLSTVPLGFKGHTLAPDFEDRCLQQLIATAVALDELHDDTGRCIRLAIEPEPFCVLETTPETIAFFDRLRHRAEDAGRLDVVQRHLGVCYDVCHQAVEFEEIAASIKALSTASIRINKLHITCALHVANPADAAVRRELATFVEPRYLHQTLARTRQGIVVRRIDLDAALCENPPASLRDAAAWRVHFHVPVHRTELGPLGTTQAELQESISAVATLDYAPHLEVETYTWGVFPGGGRQSLVDGLTAEMNAVHRWIDERRERTSPS